MSGSKTQVASTDKAETEQWSVKYRPKTLGTYLASEPTKELVRSIIEGKKTPHTIGIFGPTGCGKTTLARIIAYGLNRIPIGTANMDITEHNLSDERGIDSIRALIKGSNYHPQLRFRVRILDEIHALTPQAVSALLKPLEEPPAGVIWILCTDQPTKLPGSVLNRCMKIQLTRPEPAHLMPLLNMVAKRELPNLGVHAAAVMKAVAENSGGTPREAMQLFENFARVWHQRVKNGTAVGTEDLRAMMETAIQENPEMAANKVAVKALMQIYTGNAAGVVVTCSDVQQRESLNTLIYKLLDFNLWLLRHVSQIKSQWRSKDTGDLTTLLTARGGLPSAETVARVHATLVDMRVKQTTYAVDESHLVTATLATLAASNFKRKAA